MENTENKEAKKEEEKNGTTMTDKEIYFVLKNSGFLEVPKYEKGFDEKILVKLCQEALHALNLGHYQVRTTPSYGIWGDCNWVKKKIRLSDLLFLNSKIMENHKEAHDTIFHEIAHACRPFCSHGKKWKSLMNELGLNSNRAKNPHVKVRGNIPYKFILIDKKSKKVVRGWTRNCKAVKKWMALNGDSAEFICSPHDGKPVDFVD